MPAAIKACYLTRQAVPWPARNRSLCVRSAPQARQTSLRASDNGAVRLRSSGRKGRRKNRTDAPPAVPSARSEERRVGKECAVRVDLGGRRIIKKKKHKTINQRQIK